MNPPEGRYRRPAWCAGQIVQGILMGLLLGASVVGLLELAGNITVFSYQGY